MKGAMPSLEQMLQHKLRFPSTLTPNTQRHPSNYRFLTSLVVKPDVGLQIQARNCARCTHCFEPTKTRKTNSFDWIKRNLCRTRLERLASSDDNTKINLRQSDSVKPRVNKRRGEKLCQLQFALFALFPEKKKRSSFMEVQRVCYASPRERASGMLR